MPFAFPFEINSQETRTWPLGVFAVDGSTRTVKSGS